MAVTHDRANLHSRMPTMWREWIPFWHAGVSPHGGDVDLLFAGLAARERARAGLLFFLAGSVLRSLSRLQSGRSRRSGAQELALGGVAGRWPPWSLPRPVRLGGRHLSPDLPDIRPTNCRSTSSPSNGCGRSSIPAANAKSTSCTSRSTAPIRLIMASQDVIHSFFIPAFRIKHDVVPGRYQESRDHGATSPGTIICSARNIAAPIIRA